MYIETALYITCIIRTRTVPSILLLLLGRIVTTVNYITADASSTCGAQKNVVNCRDSFIYYYCCYYCCCQGPDFKCSMRFRPLPHTHTYAVFRLHDSYRKKSYVYNEMYERHCYRKHHVLVIFNMAVTRRRGRGARHLQVTTDSGKCQKKNLKPFAKIMSNNRKINSDICIFFLQINEFYRIARPKQRI